MHAEALALPDAPERAHWVRLGAVHAILSVT